MNFPSKYFKDFNKFVVLRRACLVFTLFFSITFSISAEEKSPGNGHIGDKSIPGPNYSEIINDYRILIPQMMERNKVLGLSIAIVDEKNIIWTEGFGFTDKDKNHAVTTETMFSIQSMSKIFTATAVMMAVQDGMLDLDAPIITYLPNFKVNSRFESHPEQKISLRNLLSHTAGFTHEAPLGNNYDIDQSSFEDHIQSISNTWLRSPVGEHFYYSNLGVDLAGYILQVVSGMSFNEYLKDKLLNPLGMNDSTYNPSEIRNSTNRAIGQRNSFKHLPVKIPMIPAGGLYTNAVELAKFVQFQLNNGKINGIKVLGNQYIKTMRQSASPVRGQTEGFDGLGIFISFGYQTNYYWHGGSGFGFISYMAWFPEYGIGMIILTNTEDISLPYLFSQQLFDRLIKLKIGNRSFFPVTKLVDDSGSYNVESATIKKYAGHYIGWDDEFDIKLIGDMLILEENPMRFVADNECFIGFNKYRFVFTADGIPKYLVRVNDGMIWDYNDGPSDKPGPNKKEWRKYVGRYKMKVFNNLIITKQVTMKNGYLYIDNLKLIDEYQTGLFFTTTGEAVDFRGKIPTFRSIKMKKGFI